MKDFCAANETQNTVTTIKSCGGIIIIIIIILRMVLQLKPLNRKHIKIEYSATIEVVLYLVLPHISTKRDVPGKSPE